MLLTAYPEIRNNIYRNVFVPGGKSAQLRYVLICKQVYNEAQTLAFLASDFRIDKLDVSSSTNAWSFVLSPDVLPESLRPFITRVTIKTGDEQRIIAILARNSVLPKKYSLS